MSDEGLHDHPELVQAEVEKIIQRLVPERTLSRIAEQPPHLHPPPTSTYTATEQFSTCDYPHQRVLYQLNTVSVGGNVSYETIIPHNL